MKIGGVLLGVACVIFAALVSAHFFFDSSPESILLKSADGNVVLSGSVYRSADVFLHEEQASQMLAPLSQARYTIFPGVSQFSPPLLATLPLSPTHILYEIDAQEGYATPLEVHYDASEMPFFLLSHGGEYAEGEAISIEVPSFFDVATSLRERLPEHATTYAIRVIAAPKNYVPTLLPALLEEGGCGGVPTQYKDLVRSEDERVAHVLVNDVLTETRFVFLMDIGIAPEGCPEDMPMQTIF